MRTPLFAETASIHLGLAILASWFTEAKTRIAVFGLFSRWLRRWKLEYYKKYFNQHKANDSN